MLFTLGVMLCLLVQPTPPGILPRIHRIEHPYAPRNNRKARRYEAKMARTA